MTRSLRHLIAGMVCAAALALAPAAQAGMFDLIVASDNGLATPVDLFALGTVTDNGDGTTSFVGSHDFGPYGLEWDILVDPDPFIVAVIGITNFGVVDQNFTITEILNIAPPVAAPSLVGGSVGGSVTGLNGAKMYTTPGSSFYTALIDGVEYETLYDHDSSFTVTGGQGTVSIPFLNFGAPIPSQIGPAVNNTIAITLDFNLTPGATGALTSNFVVIPVPPTVWAGLALLAVTGLTRRIRRRAATD